MNIYTISDRLCALARHVLELPLATTDQNGNPVENRLFDKAFPFAYQLDGRVLSDDFQSAAKPIDLLDHEGNYFYLRPRGPVNFDEAAERASGCRSSYEQTVPLMLVAWTNDLDLHKVEFWLTNHLLADTSVKLRSVELRPYTILDREMNVQPYMQGKPNYPNLRGRKPLAYELDLTELRHYHDYRKGAACAQPEYCIEPKDCC